MRKRWMAGAAACAAAMTMAGCGSTAASTGGAGGGRGGRGGAGSGPVPVVVARVVQKDVPVDLASIGNVEAFSTISIRSQITGALQDVRFHEGDFVKAGQLLFTIDPRPYKAALDQAAANLTRDRAMLVQAEAQLEKDVASEQYNAAEAQRLASL